jgi:hypothetical protein
MRFGQIDNYVNLGLFYEWYNPDQYHVNTGFGVMPTQKWKIDYIARTVFNSASGWSSVQDQEVRLIRDLHCWIFKLAYRNRGGTYDIRVQLDLKTAEMNRSTIYSPEAEKEFYPWR